MWEPFGTSIANATGRWHDGPNERGTFAILSTCFITLVICTYTSLHLNIPEHQWESWTVILWRKMGWLIIGVFAPDYVSSIMNNFEHD